MALEVDMQYAIKAKAHAFLAGHENETEHETESGAFTTRTTVGGRVSELLLPCPKPCRCVLP